MPLNSKISRPEDLRGLKATVMGLGLNGGGLASARFLVEAGAEVTVTDMKDEAALAESIASLKDLPVRYVLGRHEMSDFEGSDLVVKNPAVRLDSPYLKAARSIETDISLFLRLTASPIIAVTGSKGKSTVSSAIHHILHSAGRDSLLGGNIAISPLSFLNRCRGNTPVVLELSSWQLADLRGLGILKPAVAVLTSIMPDHMNRYSSMDEYVADKRLLYADQDESCFTICCRDESWGRSFASETRGHVLWYSASPLDGEKGAWLESSEHPCGYYFSGFGAAEEILPRDLLVLGAHQRKNLLAAALACRAFEVLASDISHGAATFPGVEHRLEFFAEKDGISWYNDSAATIPQAVAAALASFSAPPILITGGTDKNIDFQPFGPSYAKAKRIVLLAGTGTDKLIEILQKNLVPFSGPFTDLAQAISNSATGAGPGDSILLSPGCTSFGMFDNEFVRGLKFKEAVRNYLG